VNLDGPLVTRESLFWRRVRDQAEPKLLSVNASSRLSIRSIGVSLAVSSSMYSARSWSTAARSGWEETYVAARFIVGRRQPAILPVMLLECLNSLFKRQSRLAHAPLLILQ